MVHLQQQQHQIYNQTQMEQAFHQNFTADRFRQSAATFNGSSAKFSGESDLLTLLQFPRGSTSTSAIPSFGYTSNIQGKGPLYSTSTISGPVNTIYDSSRCVSYDPPLNHQYSFQNSSSSQRYFGHNLSRQDIVATERHGAAILVDLDGQESRDELNNAKSLAANFGNKREHGGKTGEPRGVNHFATERQRREFLNEKYHTLRSLVPNPTKVRRVQHF